MYIWEVHFVALIVINSENVESTKCLCNDQIMCYSIAFQNIEVIYSTYLETALEH